MSRFPLQAELIPALKKESRLPGPRANLELLQQFVAEATQEQVDLCLDTLQTPIPVDDPLEFVAMCGVAASGKWLAKGFDSYESVIRRAAGHSSWRVREAAVLALQELGLVNPTQLLERVEAWGKTTWLEKRCLAVALCDSRLLEKAEFARSVLSVLDEIIVDFETERNIKSEDYKYLKKGLGQCLSLAVVALPSEGKEYFENWTRTPGGEMRWVLNENLKLSRLRRMDADWVDQQIEYLNDAD